MTKQREKIDISTVLARIISSRDVVDVLKEKIKVIQAEQIDLDFSEVEFVSRSAAHALLELKEFFRNSLSKPKEIFFEKTNSDVTDMLRVVAANKAVPRKKEEVNLKRINIGSLLL
jgi:anti-anti-sigma regulatory factor